MAFKLVHNGNIPYLLAPNLTGQNGMLHAFTTRLGGVSDGDFSSLNLAFHVGDQTDAVIENRSKLAELFGLKLTDTVAVRQVHGVHVQKVTTQDKGQGASIYDASVPEADALVTNEPGILLWCFFADCVPVLFYDPIRKVVAATHAGWRGTHLRICNETVKVMIEEYACQPEDILAAIGPSAGCCCYEVGADVANMFTTADFKNTVSPHGEKFTVDLWQANRQVIVEAGVPIENISCAELCTSCLTPLFYSYRAEKGTTGRFAAAIMLK